MKEHSLWQRAWVEIDLDALADNYRTIRGTLKPATRLCCVVKANAYGHGAVIVASLYERLGADYLAVSGLEEALELRLGGITLPILILGYTAPDCASLLGRYQITQCVFSEDYAAALSREAQKADVSLKVHLKLDTGMGRIGFPTRREEELYETVDTLGKVLELPSLVYEGIFTHFAMSDCGEIGRAYTETQLSLFKSAVAMLKARGFTFELVHCANSAAIFDYPEAELDMVRAGIVLYGYSPASEVKIPPLTPVLSLKGVVDMVKTLHAGDSVSYGAAYVADRTVRVATVPLGYADGFSRRIGGAGATFGVRSGRATLVGKICMDQCMLDVSDVPDVSVGDVVTFYGKGGADLSVLSEKLGTVVYEWICALGERLPRVYYENGTLVRITNRILAYSDLPEET